MCSVDEINESAAKLMEMFEEEEESNHGISSAQQSSAQLNTDQHCQVNESVFEHSMSRIYSAGLFNLQKGEFL